MGMVNGTSESYSIFNKWKRDEMPLNINDENSFFPIVNSLKNPNVSTEMQEYHTIFEKKKHSPNPFARKTYHRHQVYMEDQQMKKHKQYLLNKDKMRKEDEVDYEGLMKKVTELK